MILFTVTRFYKDASESPIKGKEVGSGAFFAIVTEKMSFRNIPEYIGHRLGIPSAFIFTGN